MAIERIKSFFKRKKETPINYDSLELNEIVDRISLHIQNQIPTGEHKSSGQYPYSMSHLEVQIEDTEEGRLINISHRYPITGDQDPLVMDQIDYLSIMTTKDTRYLDYEKTLFGVKVFDFHSGPESVEFREPQEYLKKGAAINIMEHLLTHVNSHK